MKPARLLGPLLLGAAFHAAGQQAPAKAASPQPVPPATSQSVGITAPPAPKADPAAHAIKQPAPGIQRKPGGEVRAGYDGVLVRAVRSSEPLELVNPKAPASAGNSDQFLSVHPTTGKTEGIRFFSLKFW